MNVLHSHLEYTFEWCKPDACFAGDALLVGLQLLRPVLHAVGC